MSKDNFHEPSEETSGEDAGATNVLDPEDAAETEIMESPETAVLEPDVPEDTIEEIPVLGAEENAQDQREHPREDYNVGVHTESAAGYFLALAGNISRGGIFISTHHDLDRGEEVELEFLLPNDASMTVSAVVRWNRSDPEEGIPGIGLEFTELSDPDQAILSGLLSEISEAELEDYVSDPGEADN